MGKILITGGCGYIGSHTAVDLINNCFDIISIDNFINSDASSLQGIKKITGQSVKNYEVDLQDSVATKRVFKDNPDITGVIHFAALKAVGESVENPMLYYQNNIVGLLNLLQCCLDAKVSSFIFSSSCTVYGNARDLPVSENTPQQKGESPYGITKQMGEQILEDCTRNTSMKCISLRYFNPAGAHDTIELGEAPINIAQNLVPIITETAIGKRKSMTVFGDDYDTRDGSCVRDFIHIMDLAKAHTLALKHLEAGLQVENYDVYNLGCGEGVSVLEAIAAFEETSHRKLNYTIGPRRSGDVVAIYADSAKAKKILGWSPQYSIQDIMDSAWKWEMKRTKF